ncbi:MAG TPA: hypothetical protein DEA50_16240, partial [Parvularcula sp.]|nr:hypothetical protein [Parvularcula sp.]
QDARPNKGLDPAISRFQAKLRGLAKVLPRLARRAAIGASKKSRRPKRAGSHRLRVEKAPFG